MEITLVQVNLQLLLLYGGERNAAQHICATSELTDAIRDDSIIINYSFFIAHNSQRG